MHYPSYVPNLYRTCTHQVVPTVPKVTFLRIIVPKLDASCTELDITQRRGSEVWGLDP